MLADVRFAPALGRPSAPVSVLITHFGCEPFLGAAVRSILEQTTTALSVIVIDDCSPSTCWLDILEPYRSDRRLRLFSADRNVGTYRLKSLMIEHIDSPLIAFQDSDDFSMIDRISRQIAVLQRKNLDIIGCSYRTIDADGAFTGVRHMPQWCNLLERLGKTHIVQPTTCIVRATVFAQIGAFDGTTRIGADTDFILRAARRFRIGNVREPLYCYRERPGSLTNACETGHGSALRTEYMETLRRRWGELRRKGTAADLRPPAIDMNFVLREVSS